MCLQIQRVACRAIEYICILHKEDQYSQLESNCVSKLLICFLLVPV